MNQFLESSKARRSIYAINRDVKSSAEHIEALIKDAIKLAPSSFNSQSSRAVILLGASHEELWNITEEALRKIVPAEHFKTTADKIASFRAGFGSVLFFEDETTIQALQEKFALYKDNFPIWAQHSTGIAQFSVWTALANEQIGASLQHYNELIESEVKSKWNIPSSWKLTAQMPFGGIASPAGDKTFMNDAERFKTFK